MPLICRRCGVTIDMVSVTEDMQVEGSHGIMVGMDKTFSQVDFAEYDMLVLPGGGEGTQNLEAHEALMAQIDAFYEDLLKDYPVEKLEVWNSLRGMMPSWDELHRKYGN